MSQYNDVVERQRDLLAAEKWATGVKSLHFHSLKSMWYDTHPEDSDMGMVMDVEYNNGTIKRTLKDNTVRIFGKELSGEKLLDEYKRNNK
jgi:hypothetical protein|tara:strand:+ start:475 stop:744 length:270 start_codon:yes stop_codon:yes gene_type:complete